MLEQVDSISYEIDRTYYSYNRLFQLEEETTTDESSSSDSSSDDENSSKNDGDGSSPADMDLSAVGLDLGDFL